MPRAKRRLAPAGGGSLVLVHGFGTSRRATRTLARSLLCAGAMSAPCCTTIGSGPCRAVTAERERKSWERAAAFFERAEPEALAAALADGAPANVEAHPEFEPSRLYADARGVDLARIIRGGFFHVTTNDAACRALTTPTLVLVGRQDEGWRTESERLATLLPSARLTHIANAAHWAHVEQEPSCIRAITTFWGRT